MSLEPFEIERFGGLNTVVDPRELGWRAAVTAQNVTLDTDGRLLPRPGTSSFVDLSADSYQGPVAYKSVGGTAYLAAFCKTTSTKTTTLKYVTTGGTVTSAGGAWTGASAAPTIHSVAKYGDPDESLLIFTSRDGTTRLQTKSWTTDSANVTDIGVTTKPLYCAVTPNSNRLVLANFAAAGDVPAGSTGSPSTVVFSDAGATGFTATNYVYLTPGDGEFITGMATFRDFLFVFKETKFFVFYGEGTDATGNPEFSYRTVKIPVGSIRDSGALGSQRMCSAADGVYFVAGEKVYATDGGPPRVVNESIQPTADYGANVDIQAAGDHVFLSPDSTSPASYVLDTRTSEWVYWTLPAPVEFNGGLYSQTVSAGDDDLIVVLSSAVATDYQSAGTPTATMACAYSTGLQQMSKPGAEGVVREVLLEGTGTVTAQLVCDGTSSSSVSVTPTAASIGRYRKASRGRTFQLAVTSSSGLWELSRVVANVSPARPVGAS